MTIGKPVFLKEQIDSFQRVEKVCATSSPMHSKPIFMPLACHFFSSKFSITSLLISLLILTLNNNGLAQTASFTTNPAAVNGTVTICEGQSITYTSTSTGTNQNTDYDWNFQGGQPNSPNSSGPHTVTYNNDGNYTASLSLNNNSTASINVVVVNTSFNPSNFVLNSSANLGYSTYTYNNTVYFRYCGTLIPYSSNIPFNFNIPSYPAGTTININWGDGTSTTLPSGATTTSHTFPGATQNEFFMTVSYTLAAGCTITQNYGVFLGLAPTIQLSGNGNSACIPNDYTFNLLTNNVPNTTYIVIFNDNSAPDTLIAPFNSQINHTFNNSSCGTNSVISGQGGTTISYPNSFASSIIASNACGSTFSSIGPIYVGESVNADMSISPGNTICLNDTLIATNISEPGSNVNSLGCDTTNNYYWNIQPPTGFTVLTGSALGDGSSPFWPFWTTGTPVLNAQFTAPGTYNIEMTVANGCGTDSITQTINVIQFPVVPPQTITICTGNGFNYAPVNNPPTTIVPNGTTYSWTVVNNPNVTGETNGSGNSISSGTLINLTNTIQNVLYTVTPTVNGCDGPPFILTVQVVPGLVFPNYTTTICSGGIFSVTPTNNPPTAIVPSGTTYTWTPVANPNVQGEGPGFGPSITDTLTASPITPLQSVVYNVTASSGATCPAQTFQVTVFINGVNAPVIAGNQTICSGGDPLVFTTSTAASGPGTISYQWQSSTSPTGPFTPITNSNVANYNPPAGLTVTTYYQVNTTSTLNGVSCSVLSNILQVTVNSVNAGTVGSNQTICSGGNPILINTLTAATGAGTLSYQWQSSTTGATSGFTNITGATGPTYDPPGGVTTSTFYQLVVTSTLNGLTCTATTPVVTVTVNNVNPGVIAANQIICSGGDPAVFSYTTTASGTGTLSYSWQSSTTSATAGFSNIPFTGSAYNPPSGLTINTYYQVIVTSTLGGVTCPDTSNVVLVTINTITPATITSNQTICPGGDPAALNSQTLPSGSGPLTYQWFSSTTSPTAGFTAITGANSTSYDPLSGMNTTTYYYLQTTSTLNSVPCSANSNVITVTVNTVNAGTIATNQTICTGGNPAPFTNTILPTGAGALTYQWQSSTTSSSSGFSDIAGANLAQYDPPAGMTVTTYYQLVVTSTLNGVQCFATTAPITVNVNQVVASTIAANQTICSGGDPAAFTVSTAATGTASPTYQWQSSTTSSTGGFNSISGATAATYNPGPGLATTTYYQVIATSTLNGVACSATSNPLTVTVNNVSAGTIASNQTICTGGDPAVITNTIVPTGTGTLSYQWQSSTTNTVGSFSPISGATSATYDPPAGQTITTYYQLVATSTLNGVSCSATSSSITISVNTINPGVIAANQTICSGGNPANITASTAATGSGALTYAWQSSTTNATSGFAPIVGATLASYDPPVGLTATTYYQVTVTSTLNGIACSATTNAITVTINDISAPAIGASQTICSGGNPDPFFVNTAATGSGNLTYQWQASTSSTTTGFNPISGATSATYDVPSGLSTTTYYQVTTTSTLNGTTCQVISNPLTVTINNVSAGTVGGNQTICEGGDPNAFTTISAATGAGVLTYQWQSSTTSSTGGYANISGATSATYNPPSGVQTTTYYQLVVTSTLNGVQCFATTAPITVNVNQVVASTIAANQTICSGGDPAAFTVSTAATGTASPTYQWQSSTTSSTGGFNSISGATAATYNPGPGLATTTYYQVIATSTLNGVACSATSNPLTVTVNNVSAGTIASNQTICTGGDPALITNTIVPTGTGTLSYQWQSSTTNTVGSFSPISGATSATYDPPAGQTITTYYQLVATSTLNGVSCSATSSSITISVNTINPGVIAANQTICSGGNPANITASTAATGSGALTYAWQSSTTNATSGFAPIVGATLASYDPPVGLTATTYYQVTVTSTLNGIACSATTNAITVTINDISAPAIGASQTICSGGNPDPFFVNTAATGSGNLTYQWQASTSSTTTGFNPISGATSATYDVPSGLSTTTYYQVTTTSTLNGTTCQVISNPITVTINNVSAGTVAGNQTICSGGNPAPFTNTIIPTGAGVLTYQWQSSTTSSSSGFSDIAGANLAQYDPPAGMTVNTYYQLIVTSTLNGLTCSTTSAVLTVSVNNISPSAVNADQIVCSGGDPAAFTVSTAATGTASPTYQWQSSTTSSTGGFNSISGATAATYNPGPGLTTTTYYQVIATSTLNGVACSATSNPLTVTVNNVSAGTIASNQTICTGGDPAVITNTIVPTGTGTLSYQWQSSTTNTVGSFSPISGATSATYDPPAGQTITTYYQLVATSTLNGVSCSATSSSITISVNTINPGVIAANQTICSGGNPANITASTAATGSGALTYAWQSSTTNATSGFAPIVGATLASYDPPVGLTATTYYQVTVTSTLNGIACSATTNAITVTINDISAPAIGASQTICSGGNPDPFFVNTAATGSGNLTYQWQASTSSTTTGFNPISGATSATYDVPSGLSTTTYYQVTTTSTLNGTTCQVISNPLTVTINNVSAGTVGGNQTICEGGDPNAFTTISAATGAGVLTYQWQSSTTSSTGGYANISGATSATYNPPSGVQTTTYYQLVVTSTLNGVQCFATTAPITVNVNQVVASTIAANQTICSGGDPAAFTVSTAATGTASPTYQWQSSTTSSTGGFNSISGATAATYNPGPGLTTTTYYQVIATSTLNGVACSATSNNIEVTVIANPIANAGPDVIINCQNNNPGLNIGMGSIGGVSYSWSPTNGLSSATSSNPVASPSTTTNYTLTATDNVYGCTSSDQVTVSVNLSIPTVNAGNDFNITCVTNVNGSGIGMTPSTGITYSWTPSLGLSSSAVANPTATPSNTTTYFLTATNNASGCSATDNVTVTVNTTLPIANAGSDFTKTCVLNTNGAGIGDAAVSGVTYSWSPTVGLSSASISNPTANPSQTTTYAVTATNTSNGCTATDQVTVTVDNSLPTVNAGIDQVICLGGNVTLTATGADQYSWSNGITNGSAFAPGSTTTYTVTGTDLTTGCVSTDQVQVTVNPIPTVNPLSNQVLCNSTSTVAIGITGSVNGTVYNWTNSATSIGLVASGSGNIPSFLSTNATNAPVVSTITVTPSYTNLGLTCIGSSQSMTITVNPTPQVNPINNQGVCVGSNTSAVNFSSSFGVIGTDYSWTNTNSGIGIAVSGTGNIPSFTGTNTGTIPINGSFQVIPTYTNQNVTCSGTPQSFLITVNPTPTVVDPTDIVVCNNATVPTINFTGSNANSVYAWSNNNTSINLPASGTSSISSFPGTNLTNTAVTATITVTPSLTNAGITCTGTPQNFTITVNPTPTVNPLASQAVCVGSATSLINFASTLNVAGTNYNWTNTTTTIGLAGSGSGPIASFTSTNSGNTPITGTVTVTPSVTLNSVTCTGTSQSMNIVVNPIPTVIDPLDQVVCNGALTQTVDFTGGVSGTVYSWSSSNPSINLTTSGTGSIPSFVATNTTNAPISSTITVTPSYTNAGTTCTGAVQTFTITVNPSPTVDPINNQAICVGSTSNQVNFSSSLGVSGTVFNWVNSNPAIGLSVNGTGTINPFTTTNSGNTPITGTIVVTPTYTNQNVSCSGSTQSFTIVVNPNPTVVDPLDQIVCNGGQTTTVSFTGVVSGTVFNWTNTNTSINLSNSGVGNIPGFNALNSTNTATTGIVEVTPLFSNAGTTCTGNPTEFNITVLPTPTVDAIGNQVKCVGSASDAVLFTSSFGVSGTVFNWTNSNTSIGLGGSASGNIPSFTTTNSGNTMISGTVSVTPTISQGGVTCSGTVQNFSISVNPIPTVVDPTDQVVCNGNQTAAVNFSGAVAGTTYTWSSSSTAIGIASGATGNILPFTAINTTNAPIQSIITVTPSYLFGGTTCTGSSQSFTITVNPTPTVDVLANQGLCVGEASTPISFTSAFGVNGTVFNWTNSNASIGLPASGSGNIGAFTGTNLTNSPISGTITVTPSVVSNGLQCQGSTQSAVITVNPIPTVTDPLDQVLCNGTPSSAVSFNGTVNGTVYTWTNNSPSIGLSAGAIGNIPSFNAQNSGTTPVVATLSVTPSYTNASATCTGNPQTMSITVNPTPSVVDPTDIISCNGGTVPAIVFQGTGTSYLWTNTLTSIGLSGNGNGNINSFTAVNNTSNPVQATVNVTPQYTNAGLNCTGQAQAFTITVNPSPIVEFAIPNQTICSQNLSNGVTITSPTANANITWTIPSIPTNINGLTTTSGTSYIPPMTLTNTTSSPITIQIIASASTPGSLACPGAGSIYTITVNPTPQVTDPIDQVLCNTNSSAAVSFNGTGTSYTWTNTTTSIGLNASGNGTIPSFTAQNSTSSVVTSTITVTPFYLNNTVTCPGPAQTFTFTINPTPTVNAASDFTICNGELSNVLTFGGTGTSYDWTNSNTAIGLSSNGSNSIPAFQGTNTSSNAITGTITVTPIFTNLGVSCQGALDQLVITVNPSPIVDDPLDLVVCNNTQTSAVNFTGTGTSYTWTNNNTGIGLGGNGTGTIAAFNGINSTSSPVIATVTVTPQFTGTNLTCTGSPQTFTYTINPTPNVNNPVDQVVCNGQTTALVAITGTGTSYTWVNNTPSIGLPANGTGNINPFVANNLNAGPLNATVTITPTFTGSLLSCDGQPQDILFTINPTPNVVDPTDQVICNGSLTTSVNFSGNGTSYTWTNSNTAIGLPSNGTGNIAAFNAVNTTTSPISATITVTPNFTGGVASCNGLNQTFTITVNPTPTVTDLPDQVVCNGAATAPLDFVGTGTSYTWVNSNPTIGLGATGSGNIPTFLGLNSGINPITGTITVTAQYTNNSLTCSGQQQTIAITVNPTPTVIVPQNVVVCNGATTSTVILSGTGTSYNWTNSDPGIGLAANGTGNISPFNAINTSNSPIVSTINITPIFTLNGETCFGTAQQFTITVNPTPTLSDPLDQIVCNGSSTTPVNFLGTASSYSWTNTIPSIGLNAFGSGNIPAFTALNSTSTAVQAIIEVTPQFTNIGLTCSGTPQLFTIQVNPTPIVNDPLDVTFCNGNVVPSITFTGTATNYSWTNSSTAIGLAASGLGSILPFQGTNVTSTPLTSTITVTPLFTNNSLVCPGPTQNFTITINPTPIVNDPLDQAVCNQSPISAVTFTGSATSYSWTNTLPAIGLQGSGNGNILSFTTINSASTPAVANITVTPQYTGSGVTCPGSTESFTITVYPTPHVLNIPPVTICNNDDFTVNLTSDIPSNFTWSAQPTATVTGEVTVIQSSSTVNNTLTNTTLSPQNVTYVVTPVSTPEGCLGPDSSFTVTVIPDVILSIPQTIEICSGASVNAVLSANVGSTFSWFTTVDNPNVTGESITPSSGALINDILVNTTTTNQLVIYSVTPTSINGNCIGSAQTIAVTVKPPLALLNADSITICSGSSVGLNLVANTSVSFNWFAFPSVNVQGESISTVLSSVISDVLTNSTSVPQEVLYNVVGTSTANGCSSPIFPIYVTVNPIPTMSSIPNVTVCNGAATNTINFSSSNPTVQFEWTNPNTSIGLAASGVGPIPSFTAVNTGTSALNTTIIVRPIFTFNGVTCYGNNQSFTITINPTPGIYPLQNQVICANSTSSAVTIAGPVNGTVYNWINSNPTIGLGATGSNTIPTFTGQNTTFTTNAGTVTITPTYTNNAVTCLGSTSTVTFTVNPTPDVISVANQILCNGSPTAPVTFGSNVAGTQFLWTNSTPTIGLAPNGSSNIGSFTALNSTNAPLIGLISVTPSYVTNNLVCTGIPLTYTYQVNPTPTVNPISALTYCHNAVSLVDFNSTFMNNSPAVTYNWVNSNTAVGIPANGTGDINFLATNSTNSPVNAQLIVTPVYTSNGVSCNGPSQTVNITINPSPTIDAVFNQTVCANSQLTVDFTSALNAFNTNYTWVNTNTAIGLAASGGGDISFNAVNATTGPLTAGITVTPVYTNQGTICSGIPANFTITVNPIPVVSPIQNQVVCASTNSQPVNFTSNVSNTTFNWTNTNGTIGIGTSGQGNIPAFVGLNSSTSVNTGNFVVAASYTNNAVTCTGSNQLFTIAINPSASVDNVQDITLCANGLSNQISFSGNTPGAIYTWTNNNTSVGLAASGTGSIPPFTAVNNGLSISTATITVTPNYTFNGSTCAGIPEVFTISVNPIPTVSAIPNSIYCNGGTTNNVLFTGSISGTQFNWTNSNGNIGLSTSGSGTISPFVATNTGIVPIFGNLTVVPVVNYNGTSCSGNPQNFTITVNPTPNVVDPADQIICGGSPTSNVAFTGNVPNTVYSWTNSNTLTGLVTNGQGNINSFVTPSTLVNPEQSTITITPSYTNTITCTGAAELFTITVNPTPVTNDPIDQVICNGSNSQAVNFTSSVNNSSYSWTNSNANIGLGASGSGPIPAFIGTNTTNIPQVATITVTSSFTNNGLTCTGTTQTFTITVNPTPTVNDPLDLTLCNNAQTSPVNFVGNVVGTVYAWTNSLPSIGLNSSGVGNIAPFVSSNLSTTTVVANLSVTPSYTNLGVTCTGTPEDFTITVHPTANLTSTGTTICSNENVGLNLTTSIPTVISWQGNNNVDVTGETVVPQVSNTINDLLINATNVPQTVNYTIALLTSDFGCPSGPFTVPVVVNPLPDVQFTPINAPFCDLDPIQFQNNTPGTNNYEWNFGNGATSTDQNPTNVYASFGTYNVVLTATNTITGCIDSLIQPLTILSSPAVGFTTSAAEGCVLMEVVFTDIINAPNTTLTWDFGDGETSNQPFAIDHQYDEEGCYDVTLTVTNAAGCSSSLTQNDFVCAYNIPIADFIANPDSALVSDPVFEFTNQSIDAYTYLWDFGDGESSLSTNPIHEYDDVTESYVVTLFAYNEFGCYDSTLLTVTVYEDLIYYVPNSFTPNGDGTNDLFLPIITSGVDVERYQLYVFNRWGEVVFSTTDPSIGWDGSFMDVDEFFTGENNYAQDGVYTWKLILNSSQNEDAFEAVGHVTLLR